MASMLVFVCFFLFRGHRSHSDPDCMQIIWSLQPTVSSPYTGQMVDQHLEMTSTALNVSGDQDKDEPQRLIPSEDPVS